MARLRGIEASRGIAAAVVVIYHVERHLEQIHGTLLQASIWQFGHAGVDLFFVISGFIIFYVHYDDIAHPSAVRRYATRRFTRVMPVYWVALLATIILHVLGGHPAPSFGEIFWSASLLPSGTPLILDIAWTLRQEIFFYSIFCLLIWNRRLGYASLFCWLILIVVGSLRIWQPWWLPAPLYASYNLEFFFGMAVAVALKRGSIPQPLSVFALGIAAFFIFSAAEDLTILDGYSQWSRLLYGPSAALIILGTAAAEQRGLIKVSRWLDMLGSASYSIYLFQFIFIGVAWQLLLHLHLVGILPTGIVFVALATPGIGGGILVSRLVEKPLIRLLRSRGRTRLAPLGQLTESPESDAAR